MEFTFFKSSRLKVKGKAPNQELGKLGAYFKLEFLLIPW